MIGGNMTTLEEIVITTIEQSSGIELPQDERTLLGEIVSKHNFDEESARMFGEFYSYYSTKPEFLNPSKIRVMAYYDKFKKTGIKGGINTTFLRPTKDYLSSQELSRILKIINKICCYYNDLKKLPDSINLEKDAPLFIFFQEIKPVLDFINFGAEKNEITHNVGLCLDIIEKITDLDIKNNHSEHGIWPEVEFDICKESLSYLIYKLFPDINLLYSMINVDYLTLFNNFLTQLSRFNNSSNNIIGYDRFNQLTKSHSHNTLTDNALTIGIEFLSRHDPQQESLSDVFDKMMSCLLINIPDYDVIDFLGEGAFKQVYLARSKIDPEKYVAVAVFDPERIKKSGQLKLSIMGVDKLTPEELENTIRREFKPSKLDDIEHPHKQNIINIHHIGRTERFAYMTYDPYQINVRDFISQEKINYAQIRKILLGISSGLTGCHNARIIHRDLHARNIGLILDKTDNLAKAIISDFGQMSESLFAHNGGHSQMSPLQTRPPEQFLTKDEFEKYKQLNAHKFSEVDTFGVLPTYKVLDFELQKRANVFNFGCIAYQLTTGRTPFWPRNPDGTLVEDPLKQDSNDLEGRLEIEKQILEIMHIEKDSKGSYKKFLEQDPAFKKAPKYLRKIITKCLMYDPLDRYDSFDKITADLEKESWWRFILKDEQTLTPKQKIERKYSRIFYSALGISLIAGLLFYAQCSNWNEKAKQDELRILDLEDEGELRDNPDIDIEPEIILTGETIYFDIRCGDNSFLSFKGQPTFDKQYFQDYFSLTIIEDFQLPIPKKTEGPSYRDFFWQKQINTPCVGEITIEISSRNYSYGYPHDSIPIIVLDRNKQSQDLNNIINIVQNESKINYVNLEIDLNRLNCNINDIGLFFDGKALFYPKTICDFSGSMKKYIQDWQEFVKSCEHDLEYSTSRGYDPTYILKQEDNLIKINVNNTYHHSNHNGPREQKQLTIIQITPSYSSLADKDKGRERISIMNYDILWASKTITVEPPK